MIIRRITACILLAAVSGVAAPITPDAVRKHIGKEVTVEFVAKNVGVSGDNAYLELYSENSWSDPGCVFIRIPISYAKELGQAGVRDVTEYLTQRRVRATGKAHWLDFKNPAGQKIACVGVAGGAQLSILPSEMLHERLEGFDIYVDARDQAISPRECDEIKRMIKAKLVEINTMLNPKVLAEFRKFPVTIRRGAARSSMAYDWRTEENTVLRQGKWQGLMIRNWYEFLRTKREDQPLGLLHEMAHAYHHRVLGGDSHKGIQAAYKNAMDKRLYEKVKRRNSKDQKAYATTDAREYFCEITEAWFGYNDFYPFDEKDLLKHDPVGAKLMKDIWGEPRQRYRKK
jgi:hypothetical protein